MKDFVFDCNFDAISSDGHKFCVIEACTSSFDAEEGDKENTVKYVFESHSNTNLEIVLTKVVVLNEFYSTHLNSNVPKHINEDSTYHMDVVSMAKHILSKSDFDRLCNSSDESERQEAVEYIRRGSSAYRKKYHKEAYSFATKYCSWHNPNLFPIVDSYSKGMLYYLNKQFGFYTKKHSKPLTQESLKQYSVFCEAYKALLESLRDCGKELDSRKLDKFLWYYGKHHDIYLDV